MPEERNTDMKNKRMILTVAGVAGSLLFLDIFAAGCDGNKDVQQKSSEAAVVTNDNGSVSRSYVETSVTTNGSLVTEHRRETRTTLDTEGNVLETSTSEYAQSYSVDDASATPLLASVAGRKGGAADAKVAESSKSFMGLAFGEEFKGDAFESDPDEPTLLRATFKPEKPLAGFDDYYVYVTPKTHKVVKVFACAKKAVEPGARWRRHYLIEALEKRYGAWARLCSYSRPCYAFDLGNGRFVTACLARASSDYETVIVAWDETQLKTALDETEAIREEARKTAAEKRKSRVEDAAAAF
jgi:hypothetical protein